jgi:elongation factor Ts
MEITAQLVKELREKTGAGMMDCKKALAETQGNLDSAVALLREKGIAKAASKEGRATSEGLIVAHIDKANQVGVLVEINCETDFVARTDQFRNFARDLAWHVATAKSTTIDELNDEKMSNGKTVSDFTKETIGALGENMLVKRFIRFTGTNFVTTYIHPGDKLGVLVEVEAAAGAAEKEPFRHFARDIAMQVAATNPKCVRRDELDQTMIAAEKEIYRHQAMNEGKPEKIVDKIADGKVEKWYSEVVLLEQLFVKDNDKTITDLVKEQTALAGGPVQIKRFARFRLGE